MNIPTLKKMVINDLSLLSLPSEFGKNQLILITAAGIISGELPEDSDEEKNDFSSVDVISKFIGKIGTDYKKEYEIPDDQWISGNDGYVVLKNVTIRNGSCTTNVPVLAVFLTKSLLHPSATSTDNVVTCWSRIASSRPATLFSILLCFLNIRFNTFSILSRSFLLYGK